MATTKFPHPKRLACHRAVYGKRPKTRDEVIAAWRDGKDFCEVDGPYFSIRDTALLKEDGYTSVYLKSDEGFAEVQL